MKSFASVTIIVFTLIFANVIPSTSFAVPDLAKYAWPPSYTTDNYGQTLLGYSFTLVDDFNQSNAGQEFSSFGNWQVLPPCENSNDLVNCIEAVNLINSNGIKEKLVMEKLIPGNTWPAQTSPRVEAGSSASRWVSSSLKNPERGFKVTVSGSLKRFLSGTELYSAQLSSFQASVEPYEKIDGKYTIPKMYETSDGKKFLGTSTPNYCIWVDVDACGVQKEFSQGLKVELVLHLPTEISGWIMGRIDSPKFTTQTLGASKITGQSISRVTLSGTPVEVPMLSTKVDLNNASSDLNSYYQEISWCKQKLPECSGYFGGLIQGSTFDLTYKVFQLFEKSFNNTANLVVPRWSFRSLPGLNQSIDRCQRSSQVQINGIVTTNASIYQGSPPAFENDTFIYKVAGLHLLPNKEVFQGSYDLVLKSEYARCLYGFSTAPIKAAVEVTNADGTNKFVTTSFTEKDGWMSLSVKGFTFSQPTIKLKLSQEKELPNPSATSNSTEIAVPASSKTLPRKSTITCTKGKTIKKVTGTKPSCPKGYKKK